MEKSSPKFITWKISNNNVIIAGSVRSLSPSARDFEFITGLEDHAALHHMFCDKMFVL
jgi:hypothetical protein